MIGAKTVAFLEGSCALIVGTVAADGAPHASRGWGLTVLDDADVTFRLLLDADDPVLRENLETTGHIAVTAGNVRTLHSTQLKGRAVAIDTGTGADHDRARRYLDAFADAVLAVDRTPRELILRMGPVSVFAVTVAVAELYDQTPGPGAGARLVGAEP